MATKRRTTPRTGDGRDDEWLADVAAGAAKDSGAPAALLGDYLPMLVEATAHGRRPERRDIEAVGVLGRSAAEQGIPPGRMVDLYLSAAWRLWRQLPRAVRSNDSEVVRAAAEAVLRVVDDAVAALVDGYQVARRQMVRREEALRRELVDDLLRGDADVAGLVERAEPFGVDLGRSHQVILGAAAEGRAASESAVTVVERSMLDRFGDRNVLVTTKDELVVVIAPADDPAPPPGRPETGDVARFVHDQMEGRAGAPWRVAAGRGYAGAYGIARSYEEAREALTLADRLRSQSPVVRAHELLVYRVLVRDHAAIADLVGTVLTPLTRSRGGAEPLLATLEAYFAAGEVATDAARRLHLSVRAVSYRLERVRSLTGYDVGDPADRFTLYTAMLGARLLGWPEQPGGAEAGGQ